MERSLGNYTEGIITEITLRARQSDPRLLEALDAALMTLQDRQGRESLAQAALSCRRFLERLADVVFPPQTTKEGEHKLGNHSIATDCGPMRLTASLLTGARLHLRKSGAGSAG